MAVSWTPNTTPATGSVAMYSLWARLIAAGWTKAKDSDGTTYSSSGVQVTSGATGANGLANNSAWGVLVSPAGISGGSWCFQRGSTNLVWRIKYSISAGFSGGSPSATQVPSAADEYLWWGVGTDAAPTFNAFFGTDGAYRYSCRADSAAPYGFWSMGFTIGGAAVTHGFVWDPLTNTIPGDTHKYCLYGATINVFKAASLCTSGLNPAGGPQMASTVASATPSTWAGFPACEVYDNAAVIFPNGMAVDPITGNDPMHAIEVHRRAALTTPGEKGALSIMKWCGVARAISETFTISTTRDRICVGDVSLDWDGSVVTV